MKLVNLMVLPLLLAGMAFGQTATARSDGPAWTSLFNGRNLEGWDTWVGVPPGSADKKPIGANQDPLKIFSVEDGCLHISGQVMGAVTSKESYTNFHLRLEQKWGTKKWPPREQQIRDSGVLYYCTGPDGVFAHAWKTCLECQVQEGEIGDLYPLGGPRPEGGRFVPMVDIHAADKLYFDEVKHATKTGLVYAPDAPVLTGVKRRVNRCTTNEKPNGEWNVIEIICRNGAGTHIVNGTIVLELTNPQLEVNGKTLPLRSGQLQIQSEFAEVWYRNIEIQRLP